MMKTCFGEPTNVIPRYIVSFGGVPLHSTHHTPSVCSKTCGVKISCDFSRLMQFSQVRAGQDRTGGRTEEDGAGGKRGWGTGGRLHGPSPHAV